MIELVCGRPGTGKSMYLAKRTWKLLNRSVNVEKKLGVRRMVCLNFHLNKKIEEKFKERIFYYSRLKSLTSLSDVDVVIDEVATYLPADRWKDTSYEVRRMFAQHRKRGMEIYANTQAYKMVDINFRRMIHRYYELSKLIGNRDPSPTLPPVKTIWGLIAMWQMDPLKIEDDEKKETMNFMNIPEFLMIRKKWVEMYDTREDIKPAPADPKEHVEIFCERHGIEGPHACNWSVVKHV